MPRDSLYCQDFIEDARRPKRFGKIKRADAVLTSTNVVCGDELTIFLKFDGAKQIIRQVTFDGRGCMVMMASASRFLDRLEGKPLSQARKITEKDALDALGAKIAPSRKECALLPWRALQQWQKPLS